MNKPAVIVQITGMAPLSATVYEKERLRCNACQKVFTAPSPPDVPASKYDERSASMIALLKYGCGLPFNRIERLERELGIPLPAGTQWELVKEAAGLLQPVYQELIRQAAQGSVIHNDDTRIKILDPRPRVEDEESAPGAKKKSGRGDIPRGSWLLATAIV